MSNQSKIPPGPWRWIKEDNLIEMPGGGRLVDIEPRSMAVDLETRDAVAQAVAAIPEMVHALKIALSALEKENKLRYRDDEWTSVRIVREALKKAGAL